MKYLSTFKIFEKTNLNLDLNAKDYLEYFFMDNPNYDYDGERISDEKAIVQINRIINKLNLFEFPFDAYLLDEDNDIWTTSLKVITDNYKEGSSIQKATVKNIKDVNFDQTLRGRILELDTIFTKSGYVSFNEENSEISKFNLEFESYIDEIFYELKENNISIYRDFFHSMGESTIRNMNIYQFKLDSNNLFNIDLIVPALLRLDEYLLELGFTRNRPTHLKGRIDANISTTLSDLDLYMNIEELEKKSKTYSVNLPFKSLNIYYYKYIN